MSDGLIRDIALIGRYARNNEGEDWRFRSYIKGHLKLSDEDLDAAVREETDKVWSGIDCTACANCCKVMSPDLDGDDVKRLSGRLGMSETAFRRKYLAVDPVDKRSHFSALPCRFLGDDNRCTVYEDRPKACRDYPYLHRPGFRRRTITLIANCDSCPIVFNVWQALKTRLWRRRPRDARRSGR